MVWFRNRWIAPRILLRKRLTRLLTHCSTPLPHRPALPRPAKNLVCFSSLESATIVNNMQVVRAHKQQLMDKAAVTEVGAESTGEEDATPPVPTKPKHRKKPLDKREMKRAKAVGGSNSKAMNQESALRHNALFRCLNMLFYHDI